MFVPPTPKEFIVLTLFPEIFPGPLGIGVIGRALKKKNVCIHARNIRDYATNKHKTVDDTPYGGGSGMVMKPEPVIEAIRHAKSQLTQPATTILMSPQGTPLTQPLAAQFADQPNLIIICGRYEGFDERIRTHVDHEISVGDYVLSGGETAAMLFLDVVIRLLPGVLGNPESTKYESFQRSLLEHPHYTRPALHEGHSVPDVLLSGNHAHIERWRKKESLRRTLQRRPALLETLELSKEEKRLLKELHNEQAS